MTNLLNEGQLADLRREQEIFAAQLATTSVEDFAALREASLKTIMRTLSITKQVTVSHPRISQETERRMAGYRPLQAQDMTHW